MIWSIIKTLALTSEIRFPFGLSIDVDEKRIKRDPATSLIYSQGLPLLPLGLDNFAFAAFAMLGLRFCPRIRGVQHQRIYRIDPNRDYGSLASLISRADQTIDTEQIAQHWDRMGQLYASLKTGRVTASVDLKRLVGFSAKNRFYRANRDLGRIFKTEFILQYLSKPELRRRIRRGLLKVEQLHALARDVFYGRRGRINADPF